MNLYVNWALVKLQKLTIDQWNKKVKEIESLGLKKRTQNKTKLIDVAGTVRWIQSQNYLLAEVCYEKPEKFMCYYTLGDAANQNLERLHLTGKRAFSFINQRFKRKYSINLYDAFTNKSYEDIYRALKKCIPPPLNWVNDAVVGRITKNVYIGDESSSYPSKLSGTLPTLHGYKKMPGRVDPDAEYPFAFYLESGGLKIFNELEMPGTVINSDAEITILCKQSEYSLKEIMQRIYNKREEKPEYKAYMNLCIGYFQNNRDPFMSHVSAVVLARCVQGMNDRMEELVKEGNIPILANTDSISWTGGPSKLTTLQKNMGAFMLKHSNCEMAIKGPKSYQIRDAGAVITVFSGIKREVSSTFKFGDVFNYDAPEEKIKVIEENYIIHDLI